jgi:tetratricopeptide (TPR) repeat protein
VKGKEQAITAYEVLRPRRWRSRVEVSAERGLTPLVGRRTELEMLLERCASARSDQGHTVLVQGEAGIGKSRLLHEFKRRLEGAELRWLEGRCASFGPQIAYYPVIDLLKDMFEIEETAAESGIIDKVEAAVSALEDGLSVHQPYLKYLLSVDPGQESVAMMDPQMRKAFLFDALRALVLAEAARQPLIICIEDLHWMDPLSEQFLVSLAETVPEHPILLLLTARRGYMFPADARASLTRLDLNNLSEAETAAVAQGLLGTGGLPAELQELIYRKAEGNPFFVEEITKSLLEVGALRRSDDGFVLARRLEEIVIPNTVQDVIMARLDRLPEEPRRALQTASVIGREFAARLLERTVELHGRLEGHLQELQSLELIYEHLLYPELAYMFKHALTHDVAYHSLLLARRKVLHRLVGAAVEELYRERLAEQYEALAYHYEQGEVWEKALEYLQRSGDKALAAFAPQQAIAFYDRALATLRKFSQCVSAARLMPLHYTRGGAHFLAGSWDESVESFRAMLRCAREAGDHAQEVAALSQLCFACLYAHRIDEAKDYSERFQHLAATTNDRVTIASSLIMGAAAHTYTDNLTDLQKAQKEAEEGFQIAVEVDVPMLQGPALQVQGFLNFWQGKYARALAHWDEALRIGRERQAPLALFWGFWGRGLAACGQGDYELALQSLQEGCEFTERLGNWRIHGNILNTLGWVYMDLCHWQRAIEYNTTAAAEGYDRSLPETIHNAKLNLGDCYLAVGQLDEAQRHLESVDRPSVRGDVWEGCFCRYTQHLNASLGNLWLVRGEVEKALACAEACLMAAEATLSRRNIVKGRRLKAEAFLAQGRLDEADVELETALPVAREVGNPPQLWKTLAVLGRLRQAQGRRAEARVAYQEALGVVDGVAAGLSDPELRATLLASPQVSALREAADPG